MVEFIKPRQLSLESISFQAPLAKEGEKKKLLASEAWIEEHSLYAGTDPENPLVRRMMREGVKPCNIIEISRYNVVSASPI